MYERLIKADISRSQRSVLVLGPRQVGKSTLLLSLKPDLILNFADFSTFRDYSAHPDQLGKELAALPDTRHLIMLDEIQKVPALLDTVQVILDQSPKRFRFLISGSSARKLRRGSANLLPGRIHMYQLHPLLERELKEDFNLERALAHGTLPGVYAAPDQKTRENDLRTYVDAYLREEIQAEALVREIGGYTRLLDIIAAVSGSILNMHAISKEIGVSYETVRRYLDVLEDTLVAFRIPAWSGSDKGALVSHPRIYLFDLGVRNALLRRPLDRILEDERGKLFEHFMAYELHRRVGSLWPEARLFHFRTRHGAEIDFVIEAGKELWGIEVKSSAVINRSIGPGFEALTHRTAKLKRKIVIFTGERAQIFNGIEILPFRQFLNLLPP